MRNGQLLAEESPSQLMIKHNCSNLEQAFLELSKKQYTSTIGQEDENCVSVPLIVIVHRISLNSINLIHT